MKERLCLAAIVVSGLVHLGLGWQFIRGSGATFDEPVHLAAGYSYWRGPYRLNIHDHPPLAEMVEALPLLALPLRSFESHPDFAAERKYHYGDLFLQHNAVPARRMLELARGFGFAVWTLLLLPCLAWWAWRLEGPLAAAAASVLFAFSPAFISNDALVTTDGGSAALAFAAFAFLSEAVVSRRPTRWTFAAALAAGLAMAAKFNMVSVPAGLLAMLGWDAWRRKTRRPAYFQLAAILACGAAFTVGAVYRFDLALYIDGLRSIAGILQEGRSSFFWGSYSTNGTLWYFPFAFLAKTPLTTLALGFGGLAWLWQARRGNLGWDWVVFPIAAYIASALAVKVQIGYRHLLPLYPFWLIVAGAAASRLAGTRTGAALAAALLVFQAASVARAQPYALAYFNEAVGGPAEGWKYLVDSNLDWGQALPELARLMEARGSPPFYLTYFGTDDPAAWGLRYHPAAMASEGYVDRSLTSAPTESERIRLAVSATHLQSTYFADKTTFSWLKSRKPEAVAGYSIFLYDLSGDAEGRDKLAAILERDGQSGEAAKLRAWRPK